MAYNNPYGDFNADNSGIDYGSVGQGAASGAAAGGSVGGGYGALAGAVLGAGANAYASSQAPQARAPNTKRVKPPAYIDALQRLVARTLASNIGAQGPTFGQYVDSGGTKGFDLQNTDLSPIQAQQLGLVDVSGGEIPRVSPSQHKLTPEQELWLGYQQHTAGYKKGEGWRKGAMGFYDTYHRAVGLQNQLDNPNLPEKKRAKLEQKHAALLSMYQNFIDRNNYATAGGYSGTPEANAPQYPRPY